MTAGKRQIVAMGGGGFSMEPENPLLDDFILGLTGKARPRVCFVATASGDADGYIDNFYQAFGGGRCEPSHLLLFHPPEFDDYPEMGADGRDSRDHVLAQDVIYVGGGNVVAMLAVWWLYGVDRVLREAWERGVVLCGLSAGSLCWFEGGTTDSFGKELQALNDGLGLVPGSHCPHYDGEDGRRPLYHALIGYGRLAAGYAADDGVGLHFVGEKLVEAVSSRPGAKWSEWVSAP